MKRSSKKQNTLGLTAAERAVEELRAIRKQLWKEAGGKYERVVEIGRREGSVPERKRRRSA